MTDHENTPESPFLIERLMRETRRRFDEDEYSSEDEFRETMQDLIDDGMQEKRLEYLKKNPEEMAQELAFQAYESETAEQAVELADRAIELDECSEDALTIKAFLTCEDAGELIAAVEHAATCGERRLGEDFFSEFMGDFWPMVEARPYLRTIKQLAQILWSVGRRFDAVDQYQNLLDLDPGDHLGNSSLLLGCYLSMGEVQRSWDLLEEYEDETNAVHQWAWVLVFLLAGDEEAAVDAMDHALEVNETAAYHLLGMFEEPDDLPPFVGVGSEEEAALCGNILGQAWDTNPEAVIWLQEELVDRGLLEMDDEEPLDLVDPGDDTGLTKH